jgi:hypothetical protein
MHPSSKAPQGPIDPADHNRLVPQEKHRDIRTFERFLLFAISEVR